MKDQRKLDHDLLTKATHPHLSGREIRRYQPHDYHSFKMSLNSRSEMWGVDQLPEEKRIVKPLLVIGTGRCGTTWLSKSLCGAGFDVPHECVGRDGSVSLFFHSDADWYPTIPWATDHRGRKAHVGERRSDFLFRHVAHIARDPLGFEASARGVLNLMEFYWSQHGAKVLTVEWNTRQRKLRGLYYWRDVVRRCQEQNSQFIPLRRVRESDQWWYAMLSAAGLDPRPRTDIPDNNKSSGFRKHAPMSWDEAHELDEELARECRALSRKLDLED